MNIYNWNGSECRRLDKRNRLKEDFIEAVSEIGDRVVVISAKEIL